MSAKMVTPPKNLRLRILCLAVVAMLAAPVPSRGAEIETEVPRTVIALFDGSREGRWFETRLHRMAEMPLNYLGLVLEPWDLREGLPSLKNRSDVRGIIMWIVGERIPVLPADFFTWAADALENGRRVVLLGSLPFLQSPDGTPVPLAQVNQFLAKIGLWYSGQYESFTRDSVIVRRDQNFVEFERKLGPPLAAYPVIQSRGQGTTALLTVRRKRDGRVADLVVAGPSGGFASGGYTHFEDAEGNGWSWYLNPFTFFQRAFAADRVPKPDVTTLNGRRIFLSQIDGDGWRNISEVPPYRQKQELAAVVILHEIIDKYPDFPVTVAPIAADLDPRWCGTKGAGEVARKIFLRPHVEAGSHTYSHPLEWEFFATDDVEEREQEFREFYRQQCGEGEAGVGTPLERLAQVVQFARMIGEQVLDGVTQSGSRPPPAAKPPSDAAAHSQHEPYVTPRSYGKEPYTLDKEIAGSVGFIQSFLPKGKKVALYQWSGDSLPYEAVIGATRDFGLRNINGGDTRFDSEFPSVAYIAPIGRKVGRQWQIYAPNSNENTYTDLWTSRFFGFRYLIDTLENTNNPRRLKPIDVYYHMYSGEKIASLRALNEVLTYVRRQKVAPIYASTYAAIADGFYSARIFEVGEKSWRITAHGQLTTLRFDHADGLAVDLVQSKGVLGEQRHRGGLYVALDPVVREPIITLRQRDEGPVARPYLIDSRWMIDKLVSSPGALSFRAWGFGEGVMSWRVPSGGVWQVTVDGVDAPIRSFVAAPSNGLLSLNLGPAVAKPVQVKMKLVSERG